MRRFVLILSNCFVSCAIAACATRKTTPTTTPDVYFTPGTDCENAIIARINTSTAMDIAVYAISNPRIGDAIITAHGRGASIRIISDRTQAKNKASLIDTFRGAGIPVVLNRGTKIEHNKFAVFDNQTVITGSYNWTTNATKYNSENCVSIPTLATEYSMRFDTLWKKYTNTAN